MSAAANGTDVCAREAGRTRANAAAHAVQPTTAHAFNNGLHPGVCTAPYTLCHMAEKKLQPEQNQNLVSQMQKRVDIPP